MDRAVAVLVAAAPVRRVRVGEVGGHAEPFAQFRVAGGLGAVVVRDADPGPGRQRGEHEELRSDAFAGGLVGHDARHKETRAPFDLGVQVASRADGAVGLPLAEPGTVGWSVGPLVDGCPERYAAPGHAPALRPAPPPVVPRQIACPAFAARLVGVDPPVYGLRVAAHRFAAGMLQTQTAADRQRRPAPTQPFGRPRPQAVGGEPVRCF